MICPSCHITHPDTALVATPQVFAGGLLHIKGSCPVTGAFIKWITQVRPGQPRMLFFGKHKGRSYADIASADPDYLRWLAGNASKEKIRIYAIEALDNAYHASRKGR